MPLRVSCPGPLLRLACFGGGVLVLVPPYLAWGCGGGGRASPGGVPSTVARGVWGQALPLPQLPAHWAGCRGPRSTCCGHGRAGVGALLCPPGLHALWGLRAAGRVPGVRVPGGGRGGGGGGGRAPYPPVVRPGGACRRCTSTPLTSTAGHTRGHSAPGNNGGGPPRRLKPAPQRGKDTNNPSPLTQSHKQPPGAAAQPAEPGPNPAGRGAEPTVYIGHPTHGTGRRPNRTQPPTAARKTTLNAGQCVRQPGKAEGGTGSPPPRKKTEGGGGGGAKTAHSHQTARQHHLRRPNPPPRRHRRQDPRRGTGGPLGQNWQHQARNSGPAGKGTPKHADTHHEKKKSQQPSPKERGWGERDHKARDSDTQQKKKAQKTHPDNPATKGWAQPRPGPSRHAHTAGRNRKQRGASGARRKPHTSHKQAETEPPPRTPQTADTRGTTPQTVPKHTHPRPQPGLVGLTKPTPNRKPEPNTNAAQQ